MADKKEQIPVIKVVLKSQKVVYLRELELVDEDEAIRAIGTAGSDNQLLMGKKLQDEMLRRILVGIDDKRLSGQEKQNLQKLFSYSEIQQLRRVMKKMGGDDEGEPVMEIGALPDTVKS